MTGMRIVELKLEDVEKALRYAKKRFKLDPKCKRADVQMFNLAGKRVNFVIFK